MEVNYKNKKYYNTAKYPIRQPLIINRLIFILSKIMLIGQEYKIERNPLGLNGLHIEYDYCYIKPYDCVDISTDKDSFYCYPQKQNVITKLSFATEEIYRIKQEENKAKKVKS